MPDLDAAWNKAPARPEGRWRQFSAALPMRASLIAVATVWGLGCVWSFQEQSAFAASKGFAFPHLLPLVIDGFAVSMAGVSWAASLDARPAIPARLATVVAVGASSASNGVWAYLRTHHDLVTVVLGVAVPVAANLAFEVLLAELRRQVQRHRGLPPPVAVPYPRLIRLLLAPWQTFHAWRTLVLEITSMEHSIARPSVATAPGPVGTVATVVAPPPPAPAAGPVHAVEHSPRPALDQPVNPGRDVLTARDDTAPLPIRTEQAATAHWDPPAPTCVATPVPPPAPVAPRAPARVASSPAPAEAPPPSPQPAPTPTRVPSTADRLPATNGVAAADQRTGSHTENAENAKDTAKEDALGEVGTRSTANGRSGKRPVDPRVKRLAQHLATAEDADELTGEMVSRLLGIDVAPRTGRRLLGQARELVNTRALAAQGHDAELSVIGRR
jgi:hypothetical protein